MRPTPSVTLGNGHVGPRAAVLTFAISRVKRPRSLLLLGPLRGVLFGGGGRVLVDGLVGLVGGVLVGLRLLRGGRGGLFFLLALGVLEAAALLVVVVPAVHVLVAVDVDAHALELALAVDLPHVRLAVLVRVAH